MSKMHESTVEKKSNPITLFLFMFGVIVSFLALVISIEIILLDPPGVLIDDLQQYHKQYTSLEAPKGRLDVLTLKIELYKAVVSQHLTLLAIPVTILSLVMTLIMGLSRKAMVGDLLERINQHRRVLSQERKRKKDALIQLEKSEDHLHQIHEQLTEAFLVINKDERFHHANRVAVHLLSKWNRTPKSVRHYLEQPVEAFIPDYHTCGLGLCVQDAISKKISWQKELYLETIDTWLQVRVYPTGGEFAYVYMRDISDEKKPDQLKRLGENIVGAIAETSPSAIAILDRQWNYIVVSKQWREDFNLLDKDLIGKNHKAIMPRLPG
ncbi:MAG: PAS domain-containing protein [bacterium]|jgi:PAS domain-containing protein